MRKEKMADGPGTGFTFVSTRLAKGKSSRGNQYLFDFLLLPTNTQPPLERTAKWCFIFLARDIGLGLEVDLELDLDFIGLPGHGGATKVYRIYGVGRSWKFFV